MADFIVTLPSGTQIDVRERLPYVRRTPLQDPRIRFAKYVKRSEDGCWIWTGTAKPDGRGLFNLGGFATNAARVAYYFEYGEFDLSLCVCHSCDNPRCVRPDHLWLGTHADNMADAAKKGRLSGPRNRTRGGWRPLKPEQRLEVARRRKAGESLRTLAQEFGVSRTAIVKIAAKLQGCN